MRSTRRRFLLGALCAAALAAPVLGQSCPEDDPACGLTGEGQTVVVVGPQLETGHPALAGRKLLFDPETVDSQIKAGLFLPYGKEGERQDFDGVGTHLVGILLGRGTEVGSGRIDIPSTMEGEGVSPGTRVLFLPRSATVAAEMQGKPIGTGAVLCFGGKLVGVNGEQVEARFNSVGSPDIPLSAYFKSIDSWNASSAPSGETARIVLWGMGDCNAASVYDQEAQALDQAVWTDPLKLVIVGAGDRNGVVLDSPANPPRVEGTLDRLARAKNALVIGATELRPVNPDPDPEEDPYLIGEDATFDAYHGVADFSGRGWPIGFQPGAALTGRVKPDLVVPGTFLSARARDCHIGFDGGYVQNSEECSGQGQPLLPTVPDTTEALNPDYMDLAGTAQAAALVTGAAALARQYFVQLKGVPNPSAALLKAALLNRAHRLRIVHPDGSSTPIPLHEQGWGRLDFRESFFPFGRHTAARFFQDGVIYARTPLYTYTPRFSKAYGPVEITLAWTDPGTAASGALASDLDLWVKAPSGKLYRGNVFGFDEKSAALQGSLPKGDVVNTVERVLLPEIEDGVYEVQVKKGEGPWPVDSQFAQPFALAVSPSVGTGNHKGRQAVFTMRTDNVFFSAAGLMSRAGEPLVYVLKHDPALLSQLLSARSPVPIPLSLVKTSSRVSIQPAGDIWETLLWRKEALEAGQFNIVVDVDGDGSYDPGEDVADDYSTYGFEVRNPLKRLFAAYSAQTFDVEVRRDFKRPRTLYLAGRGLAGPSMGARLFVIDRGSNSASFDAGQEVSLVDVRGMPTPVHIEPDGSFGMRSPVMWNPAKAGLYSLVLDVNMDGKYRESDGDVVDYRDQAGLIVVDAQTGVNQAVNLDDDGNDREEFSVQTARNIYLLAKQLPIQTDVNLYVVSENLVRSNPAWKSWAESRSLSLPLAPVAVPVGIRDGHVSVRSLTPAQLFQTVRTSMEGTLFTSVWQKPDDLFTAAVGNFDDSGSAVLFLGYYGQAYNVVIDVNRNGLFDGLDVVDVHQITRLRAWFEQNLILNGTANGQPVVSEYRELLNSKLALQRPLPPGTIYDFDTAVASLSFSCNSELTRGRFEGVVVPGAEVGFRLLRPHQYLRSQQLRSGRYRYVNGHLADSKFGGMSCLTADNWFGLTDTTFLPSSNTNIRSVTVQLDGTTTLGTGSSTRITSNQASFCYTPGSLEATVFEIDRQSGAPMVIEVNQNRSPVPGLGQPCIRPTP